MQTYVFKEVKPDFRTNDGKSAQVESANEIQRTKKSGLLTSVASWQSAENVALNSFSTFV